MLSTAASGAADAVHPVVIQSCSPTRLDSIGRNPGALIDVVSFLVVDRRAADTVRFRVIMPDGNVHTFTARGQFAPGTLIAGRRLALDPALPSPWFSRDHRSTCSATYVHFEDGSAWIAES
jgi:hypothetical protein